ncbi:hypothetical protein pipiens_005539 [Culex pipiens pipiens]|uniref:Chitin-binding type-2 domain-containing protein n=1 Tax=Culex pipiens pipiens TaxID=38569 RepID=A0ABD1DVU2_CULPP
MNFNPDPETAFCDPFFHCGEETIAVCPRSGSRLVASTECNEFYLCLNGTEELKTCPDGTNFDPYYGTCTTSYDCNGFQCPQGACTAGMGSCHRFFFCGADDPVILECGPGWSYNPVQLEPYGGSCEENYQCQESAISENVRVLTPDQACPERGTAFRMHEQDCSLYHYCRDGVERLAFLPGPKCKLFYFCSNGFATMLQCREEENYNPKTELCDEDYICYDSPTSTTAPTTTTTVTSESPTSGPVSVLLPHQQCPQIGTAFRVHDFDCSLYFYCRDSVIRIQQCPFLHYFDMFVGRCLFRTEVQCYPGTEPECSTLGSLSSGSYLSCFGEILGDLLHSKGGGLLESMCGGGFCGLSCGLLGDNRVCMRGGSGHQLGRGIMCGSRGGELSGRCRRQLRGGEYGG